MGPKRTKIPPRSDDEVREIILQYLYDRNKNATSRRGKSSGAAVTISIMRADLKKSHELTVQQIHSNLTYLESQRWVEDQPLSKSFTTGKGGVIPSVTNYYIITAAGIDKIGGPSAFTRNRFEGIKIEATGQNIITLGDGNQIDVRYADLNQALAELRSAVKSSDHLDETKKLELVVDIDTLQAQLARPTPDKELTTTIWQKINNAASVAGLADIAVKVGILVTKLFSLTQ